MDRCVMVEMITLLHRVLLPMRDHSIGEITVLCDIPQVIAGKVRFKTCTNWPIPNISVLYM